MPKYQYYKKRKDVKSRVRALELQSRLNRPEMKLNTYSSSGTDMLDNTFIYSGLSGMDQGAGLGQRVGAKIRIHKVECLIRSTGTSVDWYILKGHGISVPIKANFHDVPNAHTIGSADSLFTTLRHYCKSGQDQKTAKLSVSFKGGLPCEFSGVGNATQTTNRLFLAWKNDTGATVGSWTYSIKVWFTDA